MEAVPPTKVVTSYAPLRCAKLALAYGIFDIAATAFQRHKPSIFEAMRKIARAALALLISLFYFSLIVTCLEYTKPQPYGGKPILFEKLIGYAFGMAVIFGWFIYLPFALLHAHLLQRYSKGHWSTSVAIGGLLGSLSAVLFNILYALDDGEWGEIGELLLLKSAVFGLTGSLYGLLYYRWVATKT
jgi:hypothetical protein